MANIDLVRMRGISGPDLELRRLEAEIARRRERVEWSLAELRERVDTATSWRHWARSHPRAWIAIGFSIGFLGGVIGDAGGSRGGGRTMSRR